MRPMPPIRRRIAQSLLWRGPDTADGLAGTLNLSKQLVYHHLRTAERAGLVRRVAHHPRIVIWYHTRDPYSIPAWTDADTAAYWREQGEA